MWRCAVRGRRILEGSETVKRHNILFVTDDANDLALARDALVEYEVVGADDGIQAIEYFCAESDCVLCLLDRELPKMDAFDLFRAIRELPKYETLPILFVNGAEDVQADIDCLKLGASDFLKKPLVKEILRAKCVRALEFESARRRFRAQLEREGHKVARDPLTGLLNRKDAEDEINALIDDGAAGTMMMIDLDNFKLINDAHGHVAGDQILTDFADILRKNFRETDLLCRIGGDEFVVFANGLVSRDEIKNRALDCIFDLDRRIKELNYGVNSSVSLGIAQTPQDGKSFNRLYYCADKALYHVKHNGKHAFYFYDDQIEEEEKRVDDTVDLYQIEEMFARLDSGRGAYLVDYDSFPVVYNFIRRFMERNGRDVQVVLFTVVPNGPEIVPVMSEVEFVLDLLKQAVYTSLRKVDASTKYSSRQVIVLLVDSNTTNGEIVAQRVITHFGELYTGDRYHLEHAIAKMPGKY